MTPPPSSGTPSPGFPESPAAAPGAAPLDRQTPHPCRRSSEATSSRTSWAPSLCSSRTPAPSKPGAHAGSPGPPRASQCGVFTSKRQWPGTDLPTAFARFVSLCPILVFLVAFQVFPLLLQSLLRPVTRDHDTRDARTAASFLTRGVSSSRRVRCLSRCKAVALTGPRYRANLIFTRTGKPESFSDAHHCDTCYCDTRTCTASRVHLPPLPGKPPARTEPRVQQPYREKQRLLQHEQKAGHRTVPISFLM